MNNPTPGTFIRPVGSFGYCMEVLAIATYKKAGDHMTCRRWGIDEQGQPVRDEHREKSIYIGMCPAGPNTWGYPGPYVGGEPRYYQQINVKPAAGQQDLFS